jgi:hypothetical protein
MEAVVPLGSLGVAVLCLIAGLASPTYGKTIVGAVIVALAWIATAIIFGLPLETSAFYSLGLITGFAAIAVVAHTLRRLVSVGWRRARRP